VGGVACFADAGSPMNKVVGIGFDGVPPETALDEVEHTYSQFGASVCVELSNLADPGVAAALSARDYRLIGFENMLGRLLPDDAQPSSSAIQVRRVAADKIDSWVDVVVEGFAHPDSEGVVSHEEFPRNIVACAMRDLEASGALAYIAECDGAIAGGGSVRITDGIAHLCGAATVPTYRRRGVQSALLSARLHDARNAGCDLAIVTTAPGSTSQRNMQRNGFQLLYTRAILTKAPVVAPEG
jgi:GNAT superfamily N-acetyltransferase